MNYYRDYNETNPVLRRTLSSVHHSTMSSSFNGYSHHLSYEQENDFDYHAIKYEALGHDFLKKPEDGHLQNVGITIKSSKGSEDDIFLKLRIEDKEGTF